LKKTRGLSQKEEGRAGAVASLATWQRAVGGSTVDRVRRGVHRSTVDRAERGAHRGSGGGRPAGRGGAPLARGRRSPGRRAGPRGGEPRAGLRRARCGGCRARLGRGRGWPGRAGRAAARGGGGGGLRRAWARGRRGRKGALRASPRSWRPSELGEAFTLAKNDGTVVVRGGRRDLGETELEEGLCDAF